MAWNTCCGVACAAAPTARTTDVAVYSPGLVPRSSSRTSRRIGPLSVQAASLLASVVLLTCSGA
eukprot:11432890-Prorocentrum_lima.AAC.1